MNIAVHVNFNGQCRVAFEFYAQHLGGKIGTLLTFEDSPVAARVAPEWQTKIVHANINIAGVELAGADVKPEEYQKPNGFYLLLGVNSATEVQRIFDVLCVDGNVIMAPQKTFWS
jgi:PhnB protein